MHTTSYSYKTYYVRRSITRSRMIDLLLERRRVASWTTKLKIKDRVPAVVRSYFPVRLELRSRHACRTPYGHDARGPSELSCMARGGAGQSLYSLCICAYRMRYACCARARPRRARSAHGSTRLCVYAAGVRCAYAYGTDAMGSRRAPGPGPS